MKPTVKVIHDRYCWNPGRVEIVDEDGANSTFHLMYVKEIHIKGDKQPDVQIAGQSAVSEHYTLLKISTSSSTNEYKIASGNIAFVRYPYQKASSL